MRHSRPIVLTSLAGLAVVGIVLASIDTQNSTLHIWRGTVDSGDTVRPVAPQAGLRLVANVAEPVITTQMVSNTQYRLRAGVLIPRGAPPDCNTNNTADPMDISSGHSADCNTNGTPDECELLGHDCNTNGTFDPCETLPGPIITMQPENRTICLSRDVMFCVTATGVTPLSYQWRRNGAILANGQAIGGGIISGAQAPCVQITPAHPDDIGVYDCVVTGCEVTISAGARLNALAQPNGDLDGDQYVDGDDVRRFIDVVHTHLWTSDDLCAGDFSGNGMLDAQDIPGFVATVLLAG